MKTTVTVLCIILLATAAFAAKPVIESTGPVPGRIACPFEVTTYEWDFNTGDQGFAPTVCDATGGEPVWAYGTDTNFPGMNLWATVLDGNYPSNSGEALVSPTFMVDSASNMVQIVHYFDTEFSYDGLNLMVNDTVVAPMDGYNDDEISDSTNYYAFCVDGQPGLSGHDLEPWVMITSCFDLAAFDGQEVSLALQFGSDSSVQYPGWYVSAITVGGTEGVATQATSWESLKANYR
jgi:hypothetical protein